MNNTLRFKLFLCVLLFYAWGLVQTVNAAALSGAYSINPSLPASATNFQNFRSAMRFLTSDSARTDGGPSNTAPFGLSGPVIFNVATAVFNEQVVVKGKLIPGLSAANTIVFDGGTGTPQVTVNMNAPAFILDQCTYVTLRKLTIVNTNNTNPYGISIIGNVTALNNGTGCKVKHCTINLNLLPTGNSTGITLTDTMSISGYSKTWADSVEIDSNTITGGTYGITLNGAANGLYSRKIMVRGNTVTKVHYGVVFYAICNGIDFLYNTISNTKDDGGTSTSEYMIQFNNCQNTGADPTRMIGNRIDANLSAVSISNNSSGAGAPFKIYNNMVKAKRGGLVITQSPSVVTYFQVYHNTIYIHSDLTSPYYAGSAFTYLPQNKTGQLKCYNNIFAVSEAKNNEKTLSVAAEVYDTASVVNYNMYYSPSGQDGRIFARNDSTYRSSLTNILTDAIAGDSSRIMKPYFVSGSDLHLTHGCAPYGIDLTVEVPYDIDGELRTTAGQAGCDEFVSKMTDLLCEAIVDPVFPASPGLYDVRFKVRNVGTMPVSSFTASYNMNGTVVSQSWSGLLNPCDTTIVIFTGTDQIQVDSTAPVILSVYVSSPNSTTDLVRTNDTLFSKQLKGIYTIGDTLCDYKTFAAATNDLNQYGIAGEVIFKVKTGTYPEQVRVIGSKISGVSSTNRITFEGVHRDSVIVTGDFTQDGTVLIMNARYVTFRKMTINNTNTVAGAGVLVIGDLLGKLYTGTGCAVKQCVINQVAADSKGIFYTSTNQWYNYGYITADSMEIDSNIIKGGTYGIYIAGNLSNDPDVNTGLKIRSNTVQNATNTGIYVQYINNGFDILYNTINGGTCLAGIKTFGCSSSSSRLVRICNNRVSSLADAGIYIAASWALNASYPHKVYNNEVVNAVMGIYYNTHPGTPNPSPTYAEVFHNSVNVNRNNSGGAYSFYFNNANTPGGIQVKNNILAITASGGVGVPVYCATAIGGPGNCNYNNYFNAVGPILIFRTNAYTKADFNTLLAGGDFSVSLKPEWVSNTDLHLTAGCKEKGTDLSGNVPKDINDSLRNTTPSMGCYEYKAVGTDLAIDALTAPVYPVRAGVQDVTIRLVNNGSSTITSAMITYKLNAAAPVTNGWSGSLAPCDTAMVVFPGLSLGATNTFKIYCATPNGIDDDYKANDTLTTIIAGSLIGTYSIGAAPSDYPTFAAATSDLISLGIGGPVVFKVKTGVYNEQVELSGSINGISAANTITFESAANHRDSVKLAYKSISSANVVLRLNNINYVTLRKMTFEALDSVYAKVIEFIGSSSYNTIKDCRIVSKSVTGGLAAGNGTDRCGVYAHNMTGRVNTISNNIFDNGQIAIHWWGISETSLSDSIVFDSNIVSGMLMYSIELKFTKNFKIRNNTISGPTTRGIYLTYCDEALEVKNNSLNLTNSGYGIWLTFCDGSLLKKIVVSNNSIIMTGSGTGTSYGIYSPSGNYQLISHNSVLIAGGIAASGYGGYFQFAGANVNNEVLNNIFANTNAGMALFFYTTLANCRSDYNLLYTTGTLIAERLAAFPNPTRIADIFTWRTLTGQDKHSVSYRPAFTSASNLVPNPSDSAVWAINGRALHSDSTWLTTDQTGLRRPLTRAEGVPDLGAFECSPTVAPPLAAAFPATMPATSSTDTAQLFLFAADTVAKITWGASSVIPATIEVRQYTGKIPPRITTADHTMYMYATINLPGAVNPFYATSLYYQDEWNGTNPNEVDLRMASQSLSNPWTFDPSGTVDTVRNIINRITNSETSVMITGTNRNNPLPVKLLDIDASWIQSDVRIHWVTASELNTDYFEVQQSLDGKSFKGFTQVKASGNSSNIRQYQVSDLSVQSIKADRFYYRLKMVDRDGSFTYSSAVSVKRNEKTITGNRAQLFPNPFDQELYIKLAVNEETTLSYAIVDITGKQLMKQTQLLTPAASVIEIPSGDLLPGIYFIQMEYNGLKKVEKVIKY